MIRALAFVAFVLISLAPMASAQTIGTFRWQLEPHCNIVSMTVTPSGGVFRMEGSDDQCGAGSDLASTIGTAFINPDGTVGIGLNVVSTPGGVPVHVDAAISVSTLNGTWRDSAGNSGNFTFRTGAGSGGSPRPLTGTIGAVSVNPAQVQLRIEGNCPSGSFMQSVSEKGSVSCAGEVGDISTVKAGPRLVGGALSGQATLSLAVTSTNAFDFTNSAGFVSSAPDSPTLFPAVSGPGIRLLWHPGSAAFRIGEVDGTQWDQPNIGRGSVAMGLHTIARGDAAFAMGLRTQAGGIGSVALGADVSASTPGTFMFGDRSTADDMITVLPNQFLVRAAGGSGIYSNAALTTGVELAPGDGQWSDASDVNLKENFRDLDGDDVLSKIARMPIREWNYRTQNAAIRHIGPTAQDFHAAFGLGQSQLRIGTIDAAGVALAAVRALEARTRSLMDENAALRQRLERIEASMAGSPSPVRARGAEK